MQKLKPAPLHPQPKPAAHYTAMSDGEAADLLRRVVAIDTDIRRLLQQIAEKRREQETLLNQARLGINPALAEKCAQCGFSNCVCER